MTHRVTLLFWPGRCVDIVIWSSDQINLSAVRWAVMARAKPGSGVLGSALAILGQNYRASSKAR